MTSATAGRVNQKIRTRAAIVAACRQLIASGALVTMPEVARLALVSEPTAYRYFPDLYSLLTTALEGMWPSPAELMAPVADSTDPVERVRLAAEVLARHVLAHQGAIRVMIAATIGRPDLARQRPGIRIALIDEALDPLATTLAGSVLTRLKQDLSVVISAEAVFSLVDLYELSPADAVASVVRSAAAVTSAALRERTG